MMYRLFLILFLIPSLGHARWPFDIFEQKKPFMLILEATGDAVTPGRTIFNNFENAVSFSLAHQIKQLLDASYLRAKIVLNRIPTEIIAPFQNAQFANKLNADLYISIHCYQQNNAQPTITFYQYSYREPTVIKKESLGFHAYDHIYLYNEPQTNQWTQELKKIVVEQNQMEVRGVYKLPFKPLLGIQASAIGLEIGINQDTQLDQIVHLIGNALQQFIITTNP